MTRRGTVYDFDKIVDAAQRQKREVFILKCHLLADLGPNTLKSIQKHYSYFHLSMITITLQLRYIEM